MTRSDLAEMVEEVKEDIGGVAAREIHDETIERHLLDGIEEMSKQIPNRALYYITLVANQPEYAVGTGVTGVLEVFPYTETDMSDIFGADFSYLVGQDVIYEWEMSQYNKLMEYLNREVVRQQYDWDFALNGKIRILPTPSSTSAAKKVYYIGTKAWTPTTLPSAVKKLAVLYGTAKTLEVLARYRARLSSPTRAGTSADYSMSQSLLNDARVLMQQWWDAMYVEGARCFWR